MQRSEEIQEVLDTIKRENRHTQLVFGGGILVLAGVMMYIAPVVIRSEFENSVPANYDFRPQTSGMMHANPGGPMHPAVSATTTVTTSTTTSSTTKSK